MREIKRVKKWFEQMKKQRIQLRKKWGYSKSVCSNFRKMNGKSCLQENVVGFEDGLGRKKEKLRLGRKSGLVKNIDTRYQ